MPRDRRENTTHSLYRRMHHTLSIGLRRRKSAMEMGVVFRLVFPQPEGNRVIASYFGLGVPLRGSLAQLFGVGSDEVRRTSLQLLNAESIVVSSFLLARWVLLFEAAKKGGFGRYRVRCAVSFARWALDER